jgi:hypothetical protein
MVANLELRFAIDEAERITGQRSVSKKNEARLSFLLAKMAAHQVCTQQQEDLAGVVLRNLAGVKSCYSVRAEICPLHVNAAPEARFPIRRPDWIFELKMDGFRAFAVIESGRVKLI